MLFHGTGESAWIALAALLSSLGSDFISYFLQTRYSDIYLQWFPLLLPLGVGLFVLFRLYRRGIKLIYDESGLGAVYEQGQVILSYGAAFSLVLALTVLCSGGGSVGFPGLDSLLIALMPYLASVIASFSLKLSAKQVVERALQTIDGLMQRSGTRGLSNAEVIRAWESVGLLNNVSDLDRRRMAAYMMRLWQETHYDTTAMTVEGDRIVLRRRSEGPGREPTQ
jgi:hypothetical protein